MVRRESQDATLIAALPPPRTVPRRDLEYVEETLPDCWSSLTIILRDYGVHEALPMLMSAQAGPLMWQGNVGGIDVARE